MGPTDILKAEHRVIEVVLGCLEKIGADASRGSLDLADARDAVEFLRTFADQCHHGKEEALLFPMVEARGFSPQQGPTAVMRHEHVLGREHVQAMAHAVDALAAGGSKAPEAAANFAVHAGQYVSLLREHIQKEDHCLFSMADAVLSEADQAALLDRFEHVEREELGEGTHERMVAIADRLADKYGASRVAPVAGGCCHLH